MQYLGLGAEIAASLLIPILAGYFLDEFLNTSPVFIMVGVGGAMISFGFMVFRIAKKLDAPDNDKYK